MTSSAVDEVADAMFRPRRVTPDAGESAVAAAAETTVLPSGAVVSSWGTGVPVLLAHGWEGRATQFGRIVDAITGSGRRAVAVDGPGHGRSPDGEFTPSRYGEILLEAAPRFGPFDAVVAHSFGSLATFYALGRGLRARSIVLIAPLRSLSERLAGLADHLGLGGAPRAAFLTTIDTRLGVGAAALDLDAQPVPQVPVLLCHDTDDQEVPIESTRQLARHWPHATLLQTEGLRHRRILQAQPVVDSVVAHIAATHGR